MSCALLVAVNMLYTTACSARFAISLSADDGALIAGWLRLCSASVWNAYSRLINTRCDVYYTAYSISTGEGDAGERYLCCRCFHFWRFICFTMFAVEDVVLVAHKYWKYADLRICKCGDLTCIYNTTFLHSQNRVCVLYIVCINHIYVALDQLCWFVLKTSFSARVVRGQRASILNIYVCIRFVFHSHNHIGDSQCTVIQSRWPGDRPTERIP